MRPSGESCPLDCPSRGRRRPSDAGDGDAGGPRLSWSFGRSSVGLASVRFLKREGRRPRIFADATKRRARTNDVETLLGTRFRYESRWRASGATTTICGRRSCERRRGPSKGGRSRVSEETAATSGGSSPARTAPARLQPNSRTPSARRTARATTGPWSARFRPTTTRGRCWGRATRRARTTRPYLRRYPTTSCSRWRGTD